MLSLLNRIWNIFLAPFKLINNLLDQIMDKEVKHITAFGWFGGYLLAALIIFINGGSFWEVLGNATIGGYVGIPVVWIVAFLVYITLLFVQKKFGWTFEKPEAKVSTSRVRLAHTVQKKEDRIGENQLFEDTEPNLSQLDLIILNERLAEKHNE